MDKLVEYLGDNSRVVYLKIDASLARQSQCLFYKPPGAPLKNRIDYSIDETSVPGPIVLSQKQLILQVKVTHVVVKVHIAR